MVQYRRYGRDSLPAIVEDNRVRVNSEGVVVYCCDDLGRTLGLWKIKTTWYTMHKRICGVLMGAAPAKLDDKVRELAHKLVLTDAETERWRALARDFHGWLQDRSLLNVADFRSQYSALFAEYDHCL